ncbi:MAG: hypothetical protein HYT71_01365 [Candidatus Aenigmarchaeota archaeon]|nr:hypothetical protein [Candidatus Aenigmarchaeota archaeon]
MWLFKKKSEEKQSMPVNMPRPAAQDSDFSQSMNNERTAVMTAVKETVSQPKQPQQQMQTQPQQEMQPMGFAVPEQPQAQQNDFEFPVEQQQPQMQAGTEWEPSTPEMAEIPVALNSSPSTTEIEEVVEAVVEEKWKQLEFRIDAIEKRFDSVNERLHDVDLQIRTLKESGTSASGGIEGKLDQYHDNLDQIDARIGSIEKAFKETLPSMIESVRAVNDSLQKINKQ